jgi:single-strand DNA-binding protein
MLRGVCKVFLVGKAGSDGDPRYTPTGSPVLRFNLVTETESTPGKELKPSPHWIKLVVVGSQAEDRDNAVSKGCTCYVEAILRTRDYQVDIRPAKAGVFRA